MASRGRNSGSNTYARARARVRSQSLPQRRSHAHRRAAVAGLLLPAGAAWALPEDENLRRGEARFERETGSLTIRQQSARAIIDWGRFGIGSDERVEFIQPDSGWVLNRDRSGAVSSILGELKSNAGVFLINPQGVLIGRGAELDVGSLVLTSADVRSEDEFGRFMSGGRMALTHAGGSAEGRLINQGEIAASSGGFIGLIGAQVENRGRIAAAGGTVQLGSAHSFYLDFTGDGLIHFEAAPGGWSGSGAGVVQTASGSVAAETVLLSAHHAEGVLDQVINLDGVVSARSMASGGGRITLDAGSGSAAVDGTLDAGSDASDAPGGRLQISGAGILLRQGSVLRAGGAGGAGAIFVGDADSRQVVLDPGASIRNLGPSTAAPTAPAVPGTVVLRGDALLQVGGSITVGAGVGVALSGGARVSLGGQMGIGGAERLLLAAHTLDWRPQADPTPPAPLPAATLSELNGAAAGGGRALSLNASLWGWVAGGGTLSLRGGRMAIAGSLAPNVSTGAWARRGVLHIEAASGTAGGVLSMAAGATLAGVGQIRLIAGANLNLGGDAGAAVLSARSLQLRAGNTLRGGATLSASGAVLAGGARLDLGALTLAGGRADLRGGDILGGAPP